MNRLVATAILSALLAALAPVAASAAETLLVDRAKHAPAGAPARGQTMQQVEARLGAPRQKLNPEGGQKKRWPTINRWEYPDYIVYFEKNKVIDVVVRKAAPNEIGPKPPVR
jgi:hypothetical protein